MIEIHIKWILVIIATAAWLFFCWYETKDDHGYIQGLGLILPTFVYMLFWIIWLIIF
jgi:hypothetical protein